MSKSEYIIWRCETREQIESEHPEYTEKQVEMYLDKVEEKLKQMGKLKIE